MTVETPSGKNVAYENFPVGSWLLAPDVRPHVAVFYAFARAIDDIADSPMLSAEEKILRLDGFQEALMACGGHGDDFAKAHAMRRTLEETGITPRHCLDLIHAFKQDATKLRYRNWDELIDYCRFSAAPVGRYLLDLHGNGEPDYPPADALCIALQIINHLQDCKEDRQELDRVYLPGDWMEAAGAPVEHLDARKTSSALRRVMDRCIDGVEDLLRHAEPLPQRLKSRRLAMESAAILDIAKVLAGRLRRGDPLARRIQLSKADYFLCCTRGAASALVKSTDNQ
ncbi:MAG: squalene synthase HpnC [Rhodospirillales bacterium]|nr:squalene synthase HpnC [Rhodospirillales bacterium]